MSIVRVRVCSYNVHGGVGTDGRKDLLRTADAIGALEPDIVLLQEVVDADALAARVGMTGAFGVTMPSRQSGFGNLILSRLPVTGVRRFDLSVPGREPRGGIAVEVADGTHRMTVLGVHLGLSRAERRTQVAALLAPDGPIAGVKGPLVLGGDFNDWPSGPVTRPLGRAFLDAAWPSLDFRATFPSLLPLLRLDRLYSRGALSHGGYHVGRSRLHRQASDHLPIAADYVIPSA